MNPRNSSNWTRRRVLGMPVALAALPSLRAAPAPHKPLVLNIRDFGATGDGKTKETAAIQQAIDRCAVLGGGEVLVPAGEYVTGAIALRSNTLLRLEKNSSILGSPDFSDYPVTQVRWEGKWIQGHVALVYAIDATNIGIAGLGKIIGNPAVGGRPTQQNPLRHPALIEPINCRDIHFEGFETSHRLMWSIHPANSENILIRNLTIRSTGGNGDGIDIDSCRHIRIENCDISTGDDCISIKSGRGSEANALMQTSEDIVITGCTMSDSIFACIGIGSETSGGIRNVRIERCKFIGAKTFAIYIKSRVGRGAFIEDIAVNEVDASGMQGGFLSINTLSSGLQDQAPVPGAAGIPSTRNFRFSNVRIDNCPVLVDAVRIHPDKPLEGFSLSRVTGTCAKGIHLANVRKVEIRDVRVTGYEGPLIALNNVTGKGIEQAAALDAPKLPDPIPIPTQPFELR